MLLRIVNLIKKMGRNGMILFFNLFLLTGLYAQINSEVGYSVSYMSLNQTNNIIKLYNDGDNLKANESVLKPIKQIHILHGFNIGVTYRINTLKIGAFWNNLAASRVGTRGIVKEDIGVEKNFYFNNNTFSLGAEFVVNHIGFGATIDYNKSTIKTKLKNTSAKVLLSPETQYTNYSNKVYLIFYARATEKFGVELKPFVSFPWKKNDVSELANLLDVGSGLTFKGEKFMHFGLTFCILNGFQPDF